MLSVCPHAPALALVEVRAARVPPDEEPHLVAEERRDPDPDGEHDDVEVGVCGGDEARGEEEGVAGDERDEDPEEQRGPGEDETEDDRVEQERSDPVEEVDEVLTQAEGNHMHGEQDKPIFRKLGKAILTHCAWGCHGSHG